MLSHVHPRAAELSMALGPCRVCQVSALVLFGTQLHSSITFTVTLGPAPSQMVHTETPGAGEPVLNACPSMQHRQGRV